VANEQQTESTYELAESSGASYYAFKPRQGISPDTAPEKQHKNPKLGEMTDLDGTLWEVREIRPTKHGFDLYCGNPVSYRGTPIRGKSRLIPSIELMEFWSDNGTRRDGVLFDLPANRNTLKSMRATLGFNLHEATHAFWEDRLSDLRLLSADEFAEKHGVSRSAALARRLSIFGRTMRPVGWWRKPKVIAILLSGQFLRIIGRQLGISTCYAFDLRARAQKLRQENNRVNGKLVSFPSFSETAKTGDHEPPLAA
jgi:hypothetical protein